MISQLKTILEEIYFYAVEARQEDVKEAESAFTSGNMPLYFDLNINLQLADVCWALEKWDEAKYWYEHNAQMMMKRRNWHKKFSEPEYPVDINADWEASTFIKAGHLQTGIDTVQKALHYWEKQPSPNDVLVQLILLAAQIGLKEFSLQCLERLSSIKSNGINELEINFVKLQVLLLTSQWNEFQPELIHFDDTIQKSQNDNLSNETINMAFSEASAGFKALARLQTGEGISTDNVQIAGNSFENAMIYFYKHTGLVSGYVYFMRLNTRFTEALASGNLIKPLPFSID